MQKKTVRKPKSPIPPHQPPPSPNPMTPRSPWRSDHGPSTWPGGVEPGYHWFCFFRLCFWDFLRMFLPVSSFVSFLVMFVFLGCFWAYSCLSARWYTYPSGTHMKVNLDYYSQEKWKMLQTTSFFWWCLAIVLCFQEFSMSFKGKTWENVEIDTHTLPTNLRWLIHVIVATLDGISLGSNQKRIWNWAPSGIPLL